MSDDALDNMPTFDPTPGQSTGPSLGQVDRYYLLEKLGQGGFGAVYRASDEVAGIEVAVKALPPLVAHNPEELQRVRDNFQLVNKLRHPHIAAVEHLHPVEESSDDALGLVKGDYLVVMEYVRGSTLSSYVRQFPERRMPIDQAIPLCQQLAETLDFAHSQMIVHRDVKPANVMVTLDQQIKVLDFGLAAEIRSSMARVSKESADTSGTRPYMAPEQWTGARLGPATDQYALAVLFHELISADVPFQSAFDTGDPGVVMNVVNNQEPAPMDELDRRGNRALLKALSKNPDDRFASCAEFIAALGGQKTTPAPTARSASRPAAATRSTTPRQGGGGRRLAVVAGIVLLLLAVAGGAAAFHLARQRRAVAAAEETRLAQLAQEQRQKIEGLLVAARQAMSQDRLSAASDTVSQLLALDPQHAAARELQQRIKEQAGMKEVVPVKSQAKLSYDKVMKLAATDGFAPLLTELKKHQLSADTYFDQKAYGDALEGYQWVVNECVRLTKLDGGRQAALALRPTAEQARQQAEQAKAPADAKAYWDGAQALMVEAEAGWRRMEFAVAQALFKQAAAEYSRAKDHALGQKAAQTAKAAYENDLAKQDRSLLAQFGKTEWTKVKEAAAQAVAAEREAKFSDAVKHWQVARQSLSAATREAQQGQSRAQYLAHLKTGEDAFQSRRYEAAAAAYKAAASVAGYEKDLKALAGVLVASREMAVVAARAAMERGDWDAAALAAARAAAIDPAAGEPKELLDAAQPRLTITALIDGRETAGAPVTIGGGSQGKTPVTVRLVKDKTYTIEVGPPPGGKVYAPATHKYVVTRMGPQSLRMTLDALRLPPDLTAVAGAKPAALEGLAAGSREALARQLECSKNLGLPLETRARQTGIVFRLVPPGTFLMGSPSTENGRLAAERQHRVTLTKPFYVGKFEVTRAQMKAVSGKDPSYFTNASPNAPAEQVTWAEAQTFVVNLCRRERVPPGAYRLLTESQWEYACRAGTTGMTYAGALTVKGEKHAPELDAIAWYGGNSFVNYAGAQDATGWKETQYRLATAGTLPVGGKRPNAWGLHDMMGSVVEWCQDYFAADYPVIPGTDPQGPASGTSRVSRGGSWHYNAIHVRAARRISYAPTTRVFVLGFRIMRVAPPPPAGSRPSRPSRPRPRRSPGKG